MPRHARVWASELPGEAPSEFRIFRAGANESSKGPAIFDEKAAASVMAVYTRAGVDLPIDLEHESLDIPLRSDSRDARGWFKLEIRNGELWAVNVRWTPDGARRLSEKTQRYISPAFYTDEEGRVVELINVALCAMPATYEAPPLVASKGRIRVPLAARIRAATILREYEKSTKAKR